MAAISGNNVTHWRDRAMHHSEVITDLWLVFNAYAGRMAEIVLFLCMVVNIVEMLPGVTLPDAATSVVLGVQVITLDIGGLSLSSMAHHARENGATKAADVAVLTSRFLIGLMIMTLLVVSIGLLYPVLKEYTDQIEKLMILIRIIMSVFYSSVIHSLRSHTLQVAPLTQDEQVQQIEALVAQRMEAIRRNENATTNAPTTQQIDDDLAQQNTPMDATLDATGAQQMTQSGATKTRQASAKVAPKNATKTAPTVRQKAQQIIAKYPAIGPVELARKADCTPSYARKILAEQKGN